MDDSTLAALLTRFRDDPSKWRTVDGRRVLREARHRYGALAVANGLDAADGSTYAWQFWTQDLSDADLSAHRADLWSYTGGAIRRAMVKEDMAQSRLVSVSQVRHVAVEGLAAPARFQSAADMAALSAELVTDPFADRETPSAPAAAGGSQAMSAMRQLLVIAGFTPVQRDLVFDEIASHLHASTSLRAAADALQRKRPPVGDDIGQERWRALVSLMLGTPKGTPGIIRLIGDGHPSPMTEPHIERLVNTFLSAPARAAAGVV